MRTDSCEYVEKTLADYEFAEDLTEKLKKLLVHDFAAKSQGEAFKEAKSDLKLGEVLVVGDLLRTISSSSSARPRTITGTHTSAPSTPGCTTGRTSMTRSIMAALSACRRI